MPCRAQILPAPVRAPRAKFIAEQGGLEIVHHHGDKAPKMGAAAEKFARED